MMCAKRISWAWLVALALCAAAYAAPYDSFEQGVPAHWHASRPGSLATSALHSKHGRHSLKWTWQRGDTLDVRCSLGNIRRTGGYGGTYGKATFGVWLYMEKPVNGEAVFEFREGDKVGGRFAFPLNFTGWQRAHLRYSWKQQFRGKVSPRTDTLRITAPKTTDGVLFIDLVVYNGVMDYRQQYVPGEQPRKPVKPDETKFPKPKTVTAIDLAGIHKISKGCLANTWLTGSGQVTEAMVAGFAKQIAAFGIVRDKHGVRGQPVVDRRHGEFYKDVPGTLIEPKVIDLTVAIGKAFHRAKRANHRAKLEAWYILLVDHMSDQGMVAGSGFPWRAYHGRQFANSTFLMRNVLRKHGRLDRASAYLDYNYRYSIIFDDTTINPDMDNFRIRTRYQFFGALVQVDPAEQVRYLNAYARRLSLEILHEGEKGYKPDGSAYHHRMHYFAYSEGATLVTADIVDLLGGTPFHITAEALARLKKVVLAERFYCNRTNLTLAQHGRHPFSKQAIRPQVLFLLARAGAATTGKLDPELASAYLRFRPKAKNKPLFRGKTIAAETDPQGNMTLNYAGITAHRRANWLAVVKGYGKYFSHGETNAGCNRFGRYLGNGYLDIVGGGNPVTLRGSGCVAKGWDFNRLDGATVIYLSDDKLRPPRRGTETMRSDQAFVGGLSHRRWNGAFVMQIHGDKRHNATSFRARKSNFFFDDRIICLGSDIENKDAVHSVQTNLFQKALFDRATPVTVDGKQISAFPATESLSKKVAHWLIDPQGTGYYLPAGQKVGLARQRQRHRDQTDRKVLQGDFATAWIDHGKAPKGAAYEYVAVVRTTPERMKAFATAPPYDVLQKDKNAHIVFDKASRTWGCVLFGAQDVRPNLLIQKVNRPCLVMLEKRGDGYHMSLADPDLRIAKGPGHTVISKPATVWVTLRGAWETTDAPVSVKVIERDAEKTVLAFTCRHGFSYNVGLRPMRK